MTNSILGSKRAPLFAVAGGARPGDAATGGCRGGAEVGNIGGGGGGGRAISRIITCVMQNARHGHGECIVHLAAAGMSSAVRLVHQPGNVSHCLAGEIAR